MKVCELVYYKPNTNESIKIIYAYHEGSDRVYRGKLILRKIYGTLPYLIDVRTIH